MLNCMIVGVGGQGTVLAARLIGSAALRNGFDVRGSETIGMAQRGGTVISHVRIDKSSIHSPLIPPGKADVIIAFEPGEAIRALPFLKKDGVLIASDKLIDSVAGIPGGGNYEAAPVLNYLKANVKRLYLMQTNLFFSQCEPRSLNVALIGAALESGVLPFQISDIETVLSERLKPQYLEKNMQALAFGQKFAQSMKAE